MPHFGSRSKRHLATCDERLQAILSEAIEYVDFSVLCGHRGKEAQDAAFNADPPRSTKQWPHSKHNRFPSPAVDVAPYPIDWQDTARFARLAGYIERIADEMGIEIRWGGDWNENWRTADERFIDMPHLELVEDA